MVGLLKIGRHFNVPLNKKNRLALESKMGKIIFFGKVY